MHVFVYILFEWFRTSERVEARIECPCFHDTETREVDSVLSRSVLSPLLLLEDKTFQVLSLVLV